MYFNKQLQSGILKAIALVMVMTFVAISACACQPRLSADQKEVCDKVDEMFEDVADILDADFEKQIKRIDGKIVYIAKLICDDADVEMAEVIGETLFDAAGTKLEREDIVLVIYYGNLRTDNVYRIYDENEIDGDKLE